MVSEKSRCRAGSKVGPFTQLDFARGCQLVKMTWLGAYLEQRQLRDIDSTVHQQVEAQ